MGTQNWQDPEDDDAPLQPGLFVENFYDGIGKGAAKEAEAQTDGTENSNVIVLLILKFLVVIHF